MPAGLITRIVRRLRARLRGDAGVTLTELIVSMALTTLLGAMTLSVFISINNASGATIDRTINSSSARNAIQAWTAYLRVSDGPVTGVRTNRIEWLTADDMLFYADLYNRSMTDVGTTAPPTMIWLRLDAAGDLVEEQFPSDAAQGTTPTVCRTLVTNVTTPVGSLFTAYDSSGAAMAMSSGQLGTAPPASTGCVTLPVTVPSQTSHPSASVQTQLDQVVSVSIDFTVSDTKNDHSIEFRSSAVLPTMGGVG